MKIKDTLQRDPAVHPLLTQGQAPISDSRNERTQAELRGELETFVCGGSMPTAFRRSSGRFSTISSAVHGSADFSVAVSPIS